MYLFVRLSGTTVVKIYLTQHYWNQILDSIVVSIPACHVGRPGFNSRSGSVPYFSSDKKSLLHLQKYCVFGQADVIILYLQPKPYNC